MLINLKNIQQFFSDHVSCLKEHNATPCIAGLAPLPDSPDKYRDYLLYTCTDKAALTSISTIPDMHIICFFDGTNLDAMEQLANQTADDLNLLLIQSAEPETDLLALEDFFYSNIQLGFLSEEFLNILYHQEGIQRITDLAYYIFANPIGVFDAGFHLIASNWESDDLDPFTKSILMHQGFSDQEYELANHDHIHEKIMHSEEPVYFQNPKLPYSLLACAIDTKRDMGHIVLIDKHRPFRPIDRKLLSLFKSAIYMHLSQTEFYRNNHGYNYESFLRDLLDGKIIRDANYAERLAYTNCEFNGNIYCIAIETARSSHIVNTNLIRNTFENNFPGAKTLMYNGAIIIFLDLRGTDRLSSASIATIQNLCKKYGLFAGLSNQFRDIIDASDYYKQALRAIELGTRQHPESSLFCYADYYLEHIANIFTQKESTETFLHTDLKILLDYDKKHHTNFTDILYEFFINERNSSATAIALNMHRNSLNQRIKKIRSLISMNWESYRERHYYILSYELYKESQKQ